MGKERVREERKEPVMMIVLLCTSTRKGVATRSPDSPYEDPVFPVRGARIPRTRSPDSSYEEPGFPVRGARIPRTRTLYSPYEEPGFPVRGPCIPRTRTLYYL
ncbi:hypothetical protein BV898_17914 [Hypsibius exemplaris]|uniref:Uncharacterized protein n=1 Tax=Hypsibius exemplaris TaxID=2072580 RepID=A0A9X6NG81_HYPEX|nr:hypothetical protein BV898_17914 [Hypsibius exemplaris]